MDLEMNQLKLSLMYLVFLSLPSGLDFKRLDLSINVVDIPLHNNINLHRKAGEMLYSDLSKSSLIICKVENILQKSLKST